jgi:hypothetical protein
MKRALLIGLLLFGMNAQAGPGYDNILELRKKAAYYQIKVRLAADEITVKEAQRLWKQQLTKLYKEEGL